MLNATPCDAWFDVPPRAEATLHAAGKALCFDGTIDVFDGKAIANALDGQPKHTVLVVRSRGGSAAAGLDAAEAVRRNGVTVVVRDFCASSCADYLFVPARRRIVLRGAMVGFHGGFSDRGVTAVLNQMEAAPNLSRGEREAMKQDIARDLRVSLPRQTLLLRALGRPDWYLSQFESDDPHELRRPMDCQSGASGAMVVVSPRTLRAIGLPTDYSGVRSVGEAQARLSALGLGRKVLCYMR